MKPKFHYLTINSSALTEECILKMEYELNKVLLALQFGGTKTAESTA